MPGSEDAVFPERLIEAETLRPTADGFATNLRLPWYRALPLSCVERIEVRVDDELVPQDDVRLNVADVGPLRLSDMAPLIDSWWYVLDSAQLSVTSPSACSPGIHNISVAVGLYIPYLPVAGSPLVNLDSNTAQLEVA